jgi:Tfp pilus assembly protein PilF
MRDGRTLFEFQGLEYSIEQRDRQVWHKEVRRDEARQVIAQVQVPVEYVIGSGRRGFSYVVVRDNFLVESPITWYARAARWGPSPGYEDGNHHFDRPLQPGCLFCHTNHVEPVGGALNEYQPPPFRGHAIGCERCHGPGQLHVRRPIGEGGKDLTIVNPADLEHSLRDAVCEQCHLSGTQRVERPGARFQDYRPGLPLHRFWTVVVPESLATSGKFVGQVEQMRDSRCYQATGGALGCISCHDPHRLPSAAERVAYYQGRCLQCHADRGCSLPASERLVKVQDDSCIECHMPRSRMTSDIPHVTMTDHRVLRHGSSTKAAEAKGQADERPARRGSLVPFHRHVMTAAEQSAARRELAIVYSREGAVGAAKALPWLEAALAADPRDVPVWQAKGVALGWLNRPEEGLEAFRTALNLAPGRELLLREAAQGAELAGASSTARQYWQRAIDVNPWRSDYPTAVARLCVEAGDWQGAVTACRQALRLNPANVEVRRWLVQSLLSLGDHAAAQAEQAILQGFGSAPGG